MNNDKEKFSSILENWSFGSSRTQLEQSRVWYCVFVARDKIPIEIIFYDNFIHLCFLLKNIFFYFFVKVLKGLTLKKEKQHLNPHIQSEIWNG